MHHREFHPQPVDGCMGCKVLGLGYDGGHLTKVSVVPNEATGQVAGQTTEHRDGRQDAIARPESLVVSLKGRVN